MAPRMHSKSSSSHQLLDVPLANAHLHSAYSVPFRLTTTKSLQQPNRPQLQRSRLQEEHVKIAGVASTSTAILVNKAIPGFKTSAAFFASLRTNLRLHASPPLPSPLATPFLNPSAGYYFPPLSPLTTPSDLTPIMDPITTISNDQNPDAPVSNTDDPLAGVPSLQTYPATTDADRTDALKLVADSVAQQRQTANSALIFHPLNLSIAMGVLAIVSRLLHNAGYDRAIIGTTAGGVLMSLLMVCRFMTQGYLFAAEDVNFKWLNGSESDDNGIPEILVTKFGEEVIGAAIVAWRPATPGGKRRKNLRGVIRAWTVRLRYRGKGVGTALLEEVVKEARKKGADNVEFDDEHANSKRILPNIYNSTFDRSDDKARALLQELLDSSSGRGKRK